MFFSVGASGYVGMSDLYKYKLNDDVNHDLLRHHAPTLRPYPSYGVGGVVQIELAPSINFRTGASYSVNNYRSRQFSPIDTNARKELDELYLSNHHIKFPILFTFPITKGQVVETYPIIGLATNVLISSNIKGRIFDGVSHKSIKDRISSQLQLFPSFSIGYGFKVNPLRNENLSVSVEPTFGVQMKINDNEDVGIDVKAFTLGISTIILFSP